jgi:hypothetical protein
MNIDTSIEVERLQKFSIRRLCRIRGDFTQSLALHERNSLKEKRFRKPCTYRKYEF